MRLSVISISFNNLPGLRKTAESVLSQSFGDFEWIVVDGGSSDGTREYIESMSDRLAWWCSEPDSGIYNAMNKGVSHANGDYCLFLNSGDLLYDEDSLARVFSFGKDADIIYGDMQTESEGKDVALLRYEDVLSFEDLVNKAIAHPSSFIRRSLLLDTPYNEGMKIVSDWEFFIKMALADKSFVHVPVVVSRYDLSGISATQSERNASERESVLRALLPRTLSNGCDMVRHMNDDLDMGRNREMIALRKKHRLFSKIVTFEILLMEKLDSVFSKKKV